MKGHACFKQTAERLVEAPFPEEALCSSLYNMGVLKRIADFTD